MISAISKTLMANTTTIAASGVPQDLVLWLDEQAKQQCTNRSTIIRQILTARVAEEFVTDSQESEMEVA
jgi:metal-responsive CopG/Arc/MetJ family transcriptional regulator